jgi:ribonuclease J
MSLHPRRQNTVGIAPIAIRIATPATFDGRDVDRMTTFARVASDNGRQFVVSTRVALLLDTLAKEGVDVPKLGKDFTVYARRMKSGELDEKDYYIWERPFIKDAVNFEHVNKHQSKVLLNLDFHHFAELVDIQPAAVGHFIHSMSEPYSEEDLEAEVMQNWLKHFKLHFYQVHASGHCSGAEIEAIVKKVRPRQLFPVHTEHPELFKGLVGQVRELIKLGETYKI